MLTPSSPTSWSHRSPRRSSALSAIAAPFLPEYDLRAYNPVTVTWTPQTPEADPARINAYQNMQGKACRAPTFKNNSCALDVKAVILASQLHVINWKASLPVSTMVALPEPAEKLMQLAEMVNEASRPWLSKSVQMQYGKMIDDARDEFRVKYGGPRSSLGSRGPACGGDEEPTTLTDVINLACKASSPEECLGAALFGQLNGWAYSVQLNCSACQFTKNFNTIDFSSLGVPGQLSFTLDDTQSLPDLVRATLEDVNQYLPAEILSAMQRRFQALHSQTTTCTTAEGPIVKVTLDKTCPFISFNIQDPDYFNLGVAREMARPPFELDGVHYDLHAVSYRRLIPQESDDPNEELPGIAHFMTDVLWLSPGRVAFYDGLIDNSFNTKFYYGINDSNKWVLHGRTSGYPEGHPVSVAEFVYRRRMV